MTLTEYEQVRAWVAAFAREVDRAAATAAITLRRWIAFWKMPYERPCEVDLPPLPGPDGRSQPASPSASGCCCSLAPSTEGQPDPSDDFLDRYSVHLDEFVRGV